MRKVNPKKHSESKGRILDAARKLFAAQGVKETSMAQVAKACRVTKAALYHYFKGKDEVLMGIFEHSLEDQDRFADSVKREGTLEDTFHAIACSYLNMIAQTASVEMMKIFQTEGMKSSALCRHYNERIKERMDNYLRLGVERGILPDVDRELLNKIVFTFFGSLEHHFMHTHILRSDLVEGGDDGYARFLAKMNAHALEAIERMASEGKIPRGGGKTP